MHVKYEANRCPRESAAFAVMSRLLSCLVTEQILPALYFTSDFSDPTASGYMVVLSSSLECRDHTSTLSLGDIFVIVPLRHAPVYKEDLPKGLGWLVELVDPLDMLPHVCQLMFAETGEQLVNYLVSNWESC